MSISEVREHADEGIANTTALATRRLCTGMYIDRSFRDSVIRDVHNRPRRRVAPSYGFDLVAVVQHSWRALGYDAALHFGLLATLGVGWLIDGPSTLTALCGITVLYLVPKMLRAAAGAANLKTKIATRKLTGHRPDIKDTNALNGHTSMLWLSSMGTLLALIAATIAIRFWATSASDTFRIAGTLLTVIACIGMVIPGTRQVAMNALRERPSLRSPNLSRRQRALDFQQTHPVVVYQQPPKYTMDEKMQVVLDSKAPPSPFVGSGRLVHRWDPPLTIQLIRDGGLLEKKAMIEREYTAPPFHSHELVEYLRGAMHRIGDTTDPIRVCDLDAKDRIFVAESDVGADLNLLGRELAQAEIRRLIDTSHQRAHHFLEVRATDGYELMVIVFVRVSVKGRTLSLDFAASALPRLRDELHLLDRYGEHGPAAVLRAAARGLRDAPTEVWQSWRLLRMPLVLGAALWARKDLVTVPRRGVPIGTRSGLRQDQAVDWDQAQFDQIVISDLIKVLERRMLRAAQDFLTDRGVDTSELARQATNIINSGVLNMSGSLDVQNAAVGSMANLSQVNMEQQHQITMQEKTGG